MIRKLRYLRKFIASIHTSKSNLKSHPDWHPDYFKSLRGPHINMTGPDGYDEALLSGKMIGFGTKLKVLNRRKNLKSASNKFFLIFMLQNK